MTDQPLRLRERKKLKTREALIEHAFRLFAEQGYARTTVAQIADAADVSPSTFFAYLESKEDAVFAGYENELASIAELLESRPDTQTTVQAIAALLRSSAEAPSEVNELRQLRFNVIERTPELKAAQRRRITSVLERSLATCYGRDLGEDPAGARPRTLAITATAALCALNLDHLARVAAGDTLGEDWRETIESVITGLEGAYDATRAAAARR